MLKIGFVDDVEFILGMLLFSGILALSDLLPSHYLMLSVMSV